MLWWRVRLPFEASSDNILPSAKSHSFHRLPEFSDFSSRGEQLFLEPIDCVQMGLLELSKKEVSFKE
ncbi:hypothetical protein SLE2022_112860 [Rubroshorea leprosula]